VPGEDTVPDPGPRSLMDLNGGALKRWPFKMPNDIIATDSHDHCRLPRTFKTVIVWRKQNLPATTVYCRFA
jgi:hypothetical protein